MCEEKEKHTAFNTVWEDWFRRTSIGTLGSSVLRARKGNSPQVGVLGWNGSYIPANSDFYPRDSIDNLFYCRGFPVFGNIIYLDLPYSAAMD